METPETPETLEKPEKKTSRRARIAWTLDFLNHDTCKLIETIFDIPDDTKFETILNATFPNPRIQTIYLRNETRLGLSKETGKRREIRRDEWSKTIAQILVGGRCFEYPQFEICYEESEINY